MASTPVRAAVPTRKASPGTWLLAVSLPLLTAAVYWPARHFGFIQFDDNLYVTDNLRVQAGLSWANARWAFTTFHAANWHPITWLSHMADVQAFGMDPGLHHLSSVALHGANTLLLFALLWSATGCRMRSWAVALVFAVHPLNVESVVWIAERKNVFSTFFWLLACWAYVFYVRRPSWWRYLLVAGAFALGLMSKAMLVTLPFTLLVLDYWPLRRFQGQPQNGATGGNGWQRAGRLVVEKLPFMAMSAAVGVVTLRAQATEGALQVLRLPLHLRLENALVNYARYLRKIFDPVNLSIFYRAVPSWPVWVVAGAAVLLVAISLWAVRASNKPYLLAGWLWFLMTLAPVIGVIQAGSQSIADRYAYVSMMGILWAAVWWAFDVTQERRMALKAGAVIAGVVCLGLLAQRTEAQESFWSDDAILFSHALQLDPSDNTAHDLLGMSLLHRGDVARAEEHFRTAAAESPADPMAYSGLGYCMERQGDYQGALAMMGKVATLTRSEQVLGDTYAYMGSLAWKLKQSGEAESYYRRAVAYQPENYLALLSLGVLAGERGAADDARQYLVRANAVRETVFGELQLGKLYKQSGREQDALRCFNLALVLSNGSPRVRQEIERIENPGSGASPEKK